jgi:hypothetical protein
LPFWPERGGLSAKIEPALNRNRVAIAKELFFMLLVSFLTTLAKRQLSFQGLTTASAITYNLLRAL